MVLVVYLEMKDQLCAQSSLAAQINDLKMDKKRASEFPQIFSNNK